MAGRLRKQFDALHELSWAVHRMSEQLFEAAPSGVFSDENFLKLQVGEAVDEKTELWHEAYDGITACDEALCVLHDMLRKRIERLPTYKPPPAVPPSVTETTSARIESPTDGPAEA